MTHQLVESDGQLVSLNHEEEKRKHLEKQMSMMGEFMISSKHEMFMNRVKNEAYERNPGLANGSNGDREYSVFFDSGQMCYLSDNWEDAAKKIGNMPVELMQIRPIKQNGGLSMIRQTNLPSLKWNR